MIPRLKYALKFINYRLFEKHKKGHGIHSPFLYKLIRNVFLNKENPPELNKVFQIFDKYKKSKEVLEFIEIGAGSNIIKNQNKDNLKTISVGKIIRTSSVNKKYGQLIYNMIQYFKPDDILELGASVGISSSFIAKAAPKSNFKSIEGIEEKINIAKKIASELNLNTEFILGDFDQVLDSTLKKYDKLGLVFFDGNHKKQSTLNYFNSCLTKSHNDTIFIFDDIHWSTEMEEAWNVIKNHEKVKVSIDLFRLGLIFFKKELSYQHYVIKF